MTRRFALVLVCSLVLAACALPHERDSQAVRKTGAEPSDVTTVLDRYREVRNTAVELLDAKPLSTVETGPVLAIDSGSFEVSQRSAQVQKGDTGSVDVTQVQTPQFTKYPLWFMAVVRDAELGVNRVQVFERGSAVEPWLLAASPETLVETPIPPVRSRNGAALTVRPDDGIGMAMSPTEAARAYATSLEDPSSPEARHVAEDSFVKQMRTTAQTNAALKGVTFSQSWGAQPVTHILRTRGGGALAFVTLLRLDTYTVKEGLTIRFPPGTPQEALLSSGISRSGTLRYYHQVLLYLPGGNGKPRAIGQYGGVVSADSE